MGNLNKNEVAKLAHAWTFGRMPTSDDLLSYKKERCLNAAREFIAEQMLTKPKNEIALLDIPTEENATVADLPALVATAISKPWGSLGLDTSSQWGATKSSWYLFQHQAEDFLRGKIDKCRLRKLQTATDRLHLAVGCLHWAGVVGVHNIPEFQSCFTTALIFDRDATAEMNGETINVSPIDTETPITNSVLLQIVDMIRRQGTEISSIKSDTSALLVKKRQQRTNGHNQANHINKYNKENENEEQRQDLKEAVRLDKANYSDPTKPRPHGYWKNLLRHAPSYPSAEALRKAVMRKRNDGRGQYAREGKKRGPYKKSW